MRNEDFKSALRTTSYALINLLKIGSESFSLKLSLDAVKFAPARVVFVNDKSATTFIMFDWR